jgi:hypothetical protein
MSCSGSSPISKLAEEGGYFTREIASLRQELGVEIVLEIDNVDEWYRYVSGFGHRILATARQALGLEELPDSRSRRLLSAPYLHSVIARSGGDRKPTLPTERPRERLLRNRASGTALS